MDNFAELSSKYKMDKKLYEIMKTYKMSLRSFLENAEINNKSNILKSFFQQGLLTLLWLYIKKGIVHNDLSYDNFFIQETSKSFITIGKNKVQLYGYYIVLADFGYAKTMEIVDYKNYPEKIATIIRNELNPITNINEFINLFNDIYLKYGVDENAVEFENIRLNVLYKELIKLYIQNDDSFQIKLNEFKNDFYIFIQKSLVKI
jgi:serine/threonine protein kinase